MTQQFEQKKSLKVKLFLSFIPFFIFLALFTYYLWSINYSTDKYLAKLDSSINNLNSVLDLSSTLKSRSNAAKNYTKSGAETWKLEYNDLSLDFDKLLKNITYSESVNGLNNDWKIFTDYKGETEKIERGAIAKADSGKLNEAFLLFNSSYETRISFLQDKLDSIIDTEQDNISSGINNNQSFLAKRVSFIAIIILLLLLTLLIIVHIFTSNIVRPIERLADTARAIADGDMTLRADIVNEDEIGTLAYNFNVMLAKLQTSHMALNKNVEDLEEANKKLKKIDQMKSDFITITAHQLRTPLTGIKWSLNALLSGSLGPIKKGQEEYLKGAIESNQRMIDTVNEILQMDNIETGQTHIKKADVSPADLLNSALADIYPEAAQKHIKINSSVGKNLIPLINIDQDAIRTVLQNLIGNSVLYTKENGAVNISITQSGDKVLISITDNGIGIPKKEQKSIFTRFFRATNAVNHFANGSGLGLAISKNIVQQHGGKIDFESEEGKGTTFNITLPIANA